MYLCLPLLMTVQFKWMLIPCMYDNKHILTWLDLTSPHLTMVIQVNIMDDSHPFCSLSIGCPIPEIKLFQTLTLKLQGQGHVCGQRAGHTICPVSYQLTSFSSHINQTNKSGDRAILKSDLETSKVKVMNEVKGQGHIFYPVSNQCTSFLFHINRANHLTLKIHIRNFKRKFAKITVFNRIPPKANQVITMTTMFCSDPMSISY